jgi:hypothetical protein
VSNNSPFSADFFVSAAPSQPAKPDLELARWLTSDAAQAELLRLGTTIDYKNQLTKLLTRLRKTYSPAQSAALLQQHELRKKAGAKFGHAGGCLFTTTGYEQSTDWAIATYKAQQIVQPWFAKQSQFTDFIDIGCGIGGDLAAVAEQRHAIGYERDPVTALFAEFNIHQTKKLAEVDHPVVIHNQDCQLADLNERTLWHLDPDRRATGQRTTGWEYCEPGLEFLAQLLQRAPYGLLKTAPATPPLPAELEQKVTARLWLSSYRECRQQLLLFGSESTSTKLHTAVKVHPNSDFVNATYAAKCNQSWQSMNQTYSSFEFHGVPGLEPEPTEHWGQYVYEPDPAILAADLNGALALELNLQQPIARIAYLTNDQWESYPLLRCYRVIEELPWRIDNVKAILQRLECGDITVKKRGVDLDPLAIQRSLQNKSLLGDATLLLYPHQAQIRCLITTPMSYRP